MAVAGLCDTFDERSSAIYGRDRTQTILVDITLQEFPDPDTLTFSYKNALLVLSQHGYNECLHFGDLASLRAGTATE